MNEIIMEKNNKVLPILKDYEKESLVKKLKKKYKIG